MEDQEILNLLEKILKNKAYFEKRFESTKLSRETRIREDLKLDFLDYYTIGYCLEEKEDLSIMGCIDDFVTLGDYVDCIKPQLEKRQEEKTEKGRDEYYI
jgi:hypothetical protein